MTTGMGACENGDLLQATGRKVSSLTWTTGSSLENRVSSGSYAASPAWTPFSFPRC